MLVQSAFLASSLAAILGRLTTESALYSIPKDCDHSSKTGKWSPRDETMKRFLAELLSYPDVPSRWRILDLDGAHPPFLTINYRWKNSTLRLFSALTTLGTPLDLALQELRIESFFPADEATRTVLNRLTKEAF